MGMPTTPNNSEKGNVGESNVGDLIHKIATLPVDSGDTQSAAIRYGLILKTPGNEDGYTGNYTEIGCKKEDCRLDKESVHKYKGELEDWASDPPEIHPNETIGNILKAKGLYWPEIEMNGPSIIQGDTYETLSDNTHIRTLTIKKHRPYFPIFQKERFTTAEAALNDSNIKTLIEAALSIIVLAEYRRSESSEIGKSALNALYKIRKGMFYYGAEEGVKHDVIIRFSSPEQVLSGKTLELIIKKGIPFLLPASVGFTMSAIDLCSTMVNVSQNNQPGLEAVADIGVAFLDLVSGFLDVIDNELIKNAAETGYKGGAGVASKALGAIGVVYEIEKQKKYKNIASMNISFKSSSETEGFRFFYNASLGHLWAIEYLPPSYCKSGQMLVNLPPVGKFEIDLGEMVSGRNEVSYLYPKHQHSFSEWAYHDSNWEISYCYCGVFKRREHVMGEWKLDDTKTQLKRSCKTCGCGKVETRNFPNPMVRP